MKAISLDAPQTFRPCELDEPAEPTADQALVQIHRIGICGTDYGGYLGKMPFFSYPRIPGHELGVEVLKVGSGVTNVAAWRSLRGRALHQLSALLRLPARPYELLRKPQDVRCHVRWRYDRTHALARAQVARVAQVDL